MSRTSSKSPASAWTDWVPVTPALALTPATLAETLDGGQSFRWHFHDEVWTGIWANSVAQLRLHGGLLEWRAPVSLATTVAVSLPRYLALECNWAALTDSLPWRSDAHLAQCIAAFPGLSLLRQPFGETLLGFLCSATKQIVQIKQIVALLAERHGAQIAPGRRRLPTWSELANASESDLRGCLLGFRARYIHQTAQFLASRATWLDETENAPYETAKERLMSLPGVGEKVADCVLLFGAGKLEAFPVDTWVLKSLARRYGLNDWKPAQVAHFGRTHFGPRAGLAQQYLFAWERRHGGRSG